MKVRVPWVISASAQAACLLLLAVFVPEARGDTANDSSDLQLALQVPQIPGLSGQAADWRQWDSFFTFVVKRLGQDIPAELKDSLADAFLDSRYELTSFIAPGRGGNPVPQLFVNGWKRLSPIVNQALPKMPGQTAGLYKSFAGAADKLASFAPSGSQLPAVQFSPDALRALARLLEPSAAGDPLAYDLNVDSGLRNLVGLGAALPAPKISPAVRQSRLRGPFYLPGTVQAALPSDWFHRPATAAEADVDKLNRWVPEEKELQAYLMAVRSLLSGLIEKVAAKTQLPGDHRSVYRHIVFAAAWQESCWRQFIKKGKDLTPLASATGDLGLMQVNRNTWRGVYDLKGLGGDIEYNSNAGGEILMYYLTRYAIRKNEAKQPGGHLARATYAAYNGGPRHLTRYRAAKQNPALKKVDEAFWQKFQAVGSGRELEVQSCYQKQK